MTKISRYIFLFVVFLIIAGVIIYINHAKSDQSLPGVDKKTNQTIQQNEPPKIVSTKPDPLEDNIVGATDTIEITFNRSLENVGEFKSHIEPKIEYKVELSGDRKTAKIIPIKALELGATYTLFIGTDTKFDGAGSWGQDKMFHFRTVKYTGV